MKFREVANPDRAPVKCRFSIIGAALRALGAPSKIDQLDFVPVWILDKSDFRPAVLHRAGLANNLGTLPAEFIASFVNIVDSQSEMAESIAEVVLMSIPIVSQLDNRIFGLVAVAHEGEGETAGRIIFLSKQFHPQNIAVEFDRCTQVVDPNHRVEKFHGILPLQPIDAM